MKLLVYTLGLVAVSFSARGQTGFGVVAPSHAVHIATGAGLPVDPILVEGPQTGSQSSESSVVVVDPAVGVLHEIPVATLFADSGEWSYDASGKIFARRAAAADGLGGVDGVDVVVTDAGSVGINAASPLYPLQVNGEVLVRHLSGNPLDGGGVRIGEQFFRDPGFNSGFQASYGDDFLFLGLSDPDGDEESDAWVVWGDNPEDDLVFSHTYWDGPVNTEVMHLDGETFDVGIGTGAPAGRLHLYEAVGDPGTPTSGTLYLKHGDDPGSNSVVFRSSPNALTDYGFVTFCDDCGTGTSNENALLRIGVANDGIGDFVDAVELVTPSGVGVNTGAPTATFDVNGDLRVRSLPVGAEATDEVVTADANGNLRAVDPQYLFDQYGGGSGGGGGIGPSPPPTSTTRTPAT